MKTFREFIDESESTGHPDMVSRMLGSDEPASNERDVWTSRRKALKFSKFLRGAGIHHGMVNSGNDVGDGPAYHVRYRSHPTTDNDVHRFMRDNRLWHDGDDDYPEVHESGDIAEESLVSRLESLRDYHDGVNRHYDAIRRGLRKTHPKHDHYARAAVAHDAAAHCYDLGAKSARVGNVVGAEKHRDEAELYAAEAGKIERDHGIKT